jgi:catechol 2,3-dioxygenase-like lactoylglutathione lyase family enzyme
MSMSTPEGPAELHTAAQRGDLAAVRALLAQGADPNARESGDNTYPLHWAAAGKHVECIRALLDAGGDVHGFGDVHELDTIGWATFYNEPGRDSSATVALLLERGARHHIFSAISLGDLDLIRQVVRENPSALERRMSRFEHRQSPLHLALDRKRYDILDLLIELGADLEATDASGQTALAVAMARGDRGAVSRLEAAGAKQPETIDPSEFLSKMAGLAGATQKIVPAMNVPDIAATLAWYTSIGFTELGRYEDGGVVNWGMLSFGNAEIMLGMHGDAGPQGVALWFYTDKVDELYRRLKARQMSDPQAGIVFEEELYDPFYGGRQFSIRDLNGYSLIFYTG